MIDYGIIREELSRFFKPRKHKDTKLVFLGAFVSSWLLWLQPEPLYDFF